MLVVESVLVWCSLGLFLLLLLLFFFSLHLCRPSNLGPSQSDAFLQRWLFLLASFFCCLVWRVRSPSVRVCNRQLVGRGPVLCCQKEEVCVHAKRVTHETKREKSSQLAETKRKGIGKDEVDGRRRQNKAKQNPKHIEKEKEEKEARERERPLRATRCFPVHQTSPLFAYLTSSRFPLAEKKTLDRLELVY